MPADGRLDNHRDQVGELIKSPTDPGKAGPAMQTVAPGRPIRIELGRGAKGETIVQSAALKMAGLFETSLPTYRRLYLTSRDITFLV